MLKLMEKGVGSRHPETGMPVLVRLGYERSCHEGVKPILHSALAQKIETVENTTNPIALGNGASAESLKKVISGARIVGVSALSLSRSPLLQRENFDMVIIDEAGQMNQPVALGALMAADAFVMVGDHKQLPPLVNSEVAESGGYGISMLKRLADRHPSAIAPLTLQYRMNEVICRLSSEQFYGGMLKCGDDGVKSQRLQLPGFPSLLPRSMNEQGIHWLRDVINPEQPVIFVDTDNLRTIQRPEGSPPQSAPHQNGCEALEGKLGGRAGGSVVNRTEAALVRYIVQGLELCGLDLCSVGVISPFRAQIQVLGESPRVATWKQQGLELSTIDKYQGRDKPTIILSLVRSNQKGIVGRLLQDPRRLNVALTRAKSKLIVVGSFKTLSSGSAPLKPILNRMKKRNQHFLLPENALDTYRFP
jgi:DNA replication ATP-dependent helicase Dna2